jgi:hypothetical protein
VGLVGGNGHGVAGNVLGTGGVDAFGVLAGHFDEGVVFDAVIGDEMVSIFFLRIWVTILEASGWYPPKITASALRLIF